MTLEVTVDTEAVEAAMTRRLRATVRATGDLHVRVIRGVLAEQFDKEHELTTEGARRWLPSQRVIFGLGGSPRTMDDTGKYRAAWTGTGPGGVTSVGERTVDVGVDATRFPQVAIHQGRVVFRGVVPRPLGMSQRGLRRSARIVAHYVATGEARDQGDG